MPTTKQSFVYESNATLEELAGVLRSAQRILVTAHAKPDGDAMGSVLALVRALQNMNKDAEAWFMGPVEAVLKSLAEQTPIHLVEDGQPADDYDLAIVCDTGAWIQLEPLEEWLKRNHENVIGFDHHVGGGDVAEKRYIDTSKASVTQILVELMDELGVELNGDRGGIAEALFVGLATDTGWFKFQNADAEAFQTASRLLAKGVDKSRLYQLIEENASPVRLALEARALTSIDFVSGGSVCIMVLRQEDFEATGGMLAELTGMVNMPLQVGTVRVSILLTQREAGITKISFRSKPASDDARFIDVNLLAGKFGGGGHPHAAGARLKVHIDEAKAMVIAAIN